MPTTVLLDAQELSSQLIDSLAETQQDWISLLPYRWQVELCTPTGLGVDMRKVVHNKAQGTVEDVVAMTLRTAYCPLLIGNEMYWVYSCCLQAIGLGRVRLVVSFQEVQQTKDCVIFVTNRLDWSPRTVMQQWLYSHEMCQKSTSEMSTECSIGLPQLVFS